MARGLMGFELDERRQQRGNWGSGGGLGVGLAGALRMMLCMMLAGGAGALQAQGAGGVQGPGTAMQGAVMQGAVTQGAGTQGAVPPSGGGAARPHPVLVELFTSEGCSSCPPADALLQQLQNAQPEPGQMIVVLSEHVTYWNNGGWADRFSRAEFDDRQSIYSGRFLLDDVYTPEAVVNGDQEMVGSDGAAVLAAVRAQPTTPVAAVRIVQVVAQPVAARQGAGHAGHGVLLTFAVDAPVPAGAEIFAAVADDMDSTAVGRGENAGRQLTHVAVARSLTRLARLKTDQAMTMTVALPGGSGDARRQHVVLFAQEAGQGRVLSVATAPVPVAMPETASR